MRCPMCGSTEVYRSPRRTFERVFNWLLWRKQRPHRCMECGARSWITLDPHAWRRTVRARALRGFRTCMMYLSAGVIAVIVAWSIATMQDDAPPGSAYHNE